MSEEMSLLEEALREAKYKPEFQAVIEKERAWWAKSRLEDIQIGIQAPEATFLGQEIIKAQIEPFFQAERFPHTLLTGVPGTGKTQLARWIAYKRKTAFEEILAPVEVARLPLSGVVLLDEAHGQRKPEPLFDLMGDDNVTVTIIAATTRPEVLDSAFRSRFFLQLHLGRYPIKDMELIIEHLADGELPPDWVHTLARASAGNPRQAERIMETGRLIGDYEPEAVLSTCRIDADGLTAGQHSYMQALKRTGRPTGLTQLALLVGMDETTVREMEPYLVELGLVEFTSSGRTLTALGRRYV